MAVGTPAGVQGCNSADIRRMDHMETGLRDSSERNSGSRWSRVHAAVSSRSHHFHMVRAYAVVAIASTTGSAGFIALAARGRW